MLSDERHDAIVASIYRAGQGEGPWADPLDAIVSSLDCWSGHLMGFEQRTGSIAFSHEAGAPPAEATLDYIRRWHRTDPRNAVLLAAPTETWTHCHEHLSETFVAGNDFYQQFLLPYGSRYVSGMHFAPSPDLTCILSFQRGIRQKPFDARERYAIERFGKHIRAAFLLHVQSSRLLKRAVAGHAILQRMRYPVMLVDDQRTLIFENPPARLLLELARVVARRGERLALVDRDADVELTAMIKASSINSNSSAFKAFLKMGAEGTACLLHIARLTPEETLQAFGNVPVLLLTVFDMATRTKADAFLLGTAFDLTPAEARIAAASADGLADAQISGLTSTSVSTVRSHMRRIYAKTGASRRADLVRLLNSNVALWR